MLFNSLTFWMFIPAFFVVYFATKGNARLWICLAGSYLFYGWWDWRFLGLIGILTVSNFWFGLKIYESSKQTRKKHYVTASVVLSLIILGFFKYFNFFTESLADIMQVIGLQYNTGTMNIILPVGISFYTFQTMSYTIDLYRNKVDVEHSLLKFSVFVSFFPQLVAGPIVRASEFIPQLYRDHPFNWDRMVTGFCLVAWGFVLKSALADSLAPVVDNRFASPEAMSAISLIIGVLFYAFQIYGDFAGYSLIAIGFARMLGFDFRRNFHSPYFATSFSNFWQRWHISLSSWLRDYLYIPLGGNRKGSRRTYINLMLTMLLGGLWHGAAWTFVVWGFMHGAYLCIQKGLLKVFSAWQGFLVNNWKWLVKLSAMPVVFFAVCVTWIFFRADSFETAFTIVRRITEMDNLNFYSVEGTFKVVKGLGLIGIVVVGEGVAANVDVWKLGSRKPWLYGLFILACLCMLSFLGTFGQSAFIYFQF